MSMWNACLFFASLSVVACTTPGSFSGEPASHAGAKADAVADGRFDRWVVRNDLDVPVLVHTGGPDVRFIWVNGTEADGFEVAASSISDVAPLYGEELAITTITGAVIDIDRVEGRFYDDDDGYRVLELTLADRDAFVLDPPIDAIDGDALDAPLADERHVPFGEERVQSVGADSYDKTVFAAWVTSRSERDRLRRQARDQAWLEGYHRGMPNREKDIDSCKAMGGVGFMVIAESCGYRPADEFILGDSACHAYCLFTYQCYRIE